MHQYRYNPTSLIHKHYSLIYSFYRYPNDEDKKNSACTPIPAPHEPVDWFQISHTANINNERLGKLLGVSWMRNNRLSPMSHITLFSFVKLMYQLPQMIGRIQEKNKLFGEQENVYGKFD